ncbi:MAG: pitrilysin family protein [Acidimicrobiales bacterium]
MTTIVRPPIRDLVPRGAPTIVSSDVSGQLRVVAVRRPSVPLVEARLVVPLGPDQISNSAGPLVLSESLLAGTEDRDRAEIASTVERLGGTLGVGINLDAFIVGASALAENFTELLTLIGEVLVSATFPSAEVSADRARIADEVAIALSRPETIADELFDAAIYAGHPYATPIPRPAAIRRVTSPALRDLRRKVISSRGATLVVVGDVRTRDVAPVAEDALGAWIASSRRKATGLPRVKDVEPGPLRLRDRPGAVQSNLRLGASAPDRMSTDWPATALATLVIGGMFTSRLVTNLRERNGYSYSPRLRVHHGRAGSVSTFTAEVATDVTAASLIESRYEFGRAAATGIEQDELDAARRYAIGTFLASTATQSGLASTLARLLADEVEPGYLASYPASLRRVTLSEVDEAARKFLAPSRFTTIVVGDAERVASQLAIVEEFVEAV